MSGGQNFGGEASLLCGFGPDLGGGEKRSYLQFSLSGIPANSTLTAATLQLYIGSAPPGPITIGAYKVTGSWDEATVTFNNQPACESSAAASASVSQGETGVWKSWSLTSLASGWYDGSVANNGIVLKQTSGTPPNNVTFRSSDYGADTTLRPKLVVTYTAGGGATPATLTLTANPTTVTADGVSASTLTATVLDQNGAPLVTQVVNLQTTLGTLASNQLTTGAEGKATTQLSSAVEGIATVTASCSGLSATCTVTFVPPSTPPTLEVTANPASIPANGQSTSTITANYHNANGAPIGGATITFTTTSGAVAPTTATTNEQVQATTTLTASNQPGTATVTASCGDVEGTTTVTFTQPGGTPATLTLAAQPTTVPADGTTASTVTATVKDANGNALANQTVSLTTTLGTLAATQLTTGADGKASTQLTATTQGTATVTATCSGLQAQGTVTFTDPNAGQPQTALTVTADPQEIPADGQSTSTVTAQVTVDGQPAPDGTEVTFTTAWGAVQGADPATPQSLQAVTTNGVATAVLVAGTSDPPGGTFTVSASSEAAAASVTMQVGEPPPPGGVQAEVWIVCGAQGTVAQIEGVLVCGRFRVGQGAPPGVYDVTPILMAQGGSDPLCPICCRWAWDDPLSLPVENPEPGVWYTGEWLFLWDTLAHHNHGAVTVWPVMNVFRNYEGPIISVEGAARSPSVSNLQSSQVEPHPDPSPSSSSYLTVATDTQSVDTSFQLEDHIWSETNYEVTVYKLDGTLVRKMSGVARQAGNVTVTWDCKDQQGQRVPVGVYPFKVHCWHEQGRTTSLFGTDVMAFEEPPWGLIGTAPDFDDSRSTTLGVKEVTATLGDETAGGARDLTVRYRLADSRGWPATRVDLIVLGPDFQPRTVIPATGHPTALNPHPYQLAHEVTVWVEGMQQPGRYSVLVNAYDNGYRDKRLRPELADLGAGATGAAVYVPSATLEILRPTPGAVLGGSVDVLVQSTTIGADLSSLKLEGREKDNNLHPTEWFTIADGAPGDPQTFEVVSDTWNGEVHEVIYRARWNTLTAHNFEHTLRVTGTFAPVSGGEALTRQSETDVVVKNLVIDVAAMTPDLLLFDPANPTGPEVRVPLDDAVAQDTEVAVKVCRLQRGEGEGALRVLRPTVAVPGTATVVWDGRAATTDAQGNEVLGEVQPRGVYVYEVEAKHTQEGGEDKDESKSPALTITSASANRSQLRPSLGETITFTYTLANSTNPQSAASSARLLILDSDLNTAATLTGGTADGENTVTWDPADDLEPDLYYFVVQAWDNGEGPHGVNGAVVRKALEKGGWFSVPIRVRDATSDEEGSSGVCEAFGYAILWNVSADPIHPQHRAVLRFRLETRCRHALTGKLRIYSPPYGASDPGAGIRDQVIAPLLEVPLETAPVQLPNAVELHVGANQWEWDGHDSGGNLREPGLYPFVVEVEHRDPLEHPEGKDSTLSKLLDLVNVFVQKSNPFRPCSPREPERHFEVDYHFKLRTEGTPPATTRGKTYLKFYDKDLRFVAHGWLDDEQWQGPGERILERVKTLSEMELDSLRRVGEYYWVLNAIEGNGSPGEGDNAVPALGKVVVPPSLSVEKITFVDDGAKVLLLDDKGNDLPVPEWQREVNETAFACYLRSANAPAEARKIEIRVEFSCTPGTEYTVKPQGVPLGFGGFEVAAPHTFAPQSCSEIKTFELFEPAPEVIASEPFTWYWVFHDATDATDREAGTTGGALYFLNGTEKPDLGEIQAGKTYHLIARETCRWAHNTRQSVTGDNGRGWDDGVLKNYPAFEAIWNGISQLKVDDGPSGPLRYWWQDDAPGESTELIKTRDGTCDAWADLFDRMLLTHGIKAPIRSWIDPPFESGGLDNLEVKEGIPAQGNAQPPRQFKDHAVCFYAGIIWDPSYGRYGDIGVNQRARLLNYENATFSRYRKTLLDWDDNDPDELEVILQGYYPEP